MYRKNVSFTEVLNNTVKSCSSTFGSVLQLNVEITGQTVEGWNQEDKLGFKYEKIDNPWKFFSLILSNFSDMIVENCPDWRGDAVSSSSLRSNNSNGIDISNFAYGLVSGIVVGGLIVTGCYMLKKYISETPNHGGGGNAPNKIVYDEDEVDPNTVLNNLRETKLYSGKFKDSYW